MRKYLLHVLIISFLLASLTGCGTTLKQGFVSDAEVKVETEKQQDMAFSMFMKSRDKLHSIAYPLLVAAGDIFPKQARPICGFKLHDKYLYGELLSSEFEEVAERHGIGELITVEYIHPGLPVGSTDLKVGDQVLSINDKSLVGKNALAATKIIQRLKKHTSIKLLIKRNFQTRSLIVPCILGCRYPVKIENKDEVNAYADNKNVTITTGLIRFCEKSDKELAFVLGHEIAHNALKHVTKSQGNALLGLIVDVAIQAATGLDTGGTFSNIAGSAFSVAFEEEADYAGLYILSRAKYDIAGTGNFIRRMAIRFPVDTKGSFLATHPADPKRFVSIEHTINEINDKILNGIPIFPEKKAKDTDREPTPPVTIQQEPPYVGASITKLRSSYKTLSVSQVHSMPNVSIHEKKDWGFFGHSTINHDYNLKTIGGDKVAVDNATGQMWHQSGSDYQMHWDDAKEWVEDLNSEGYAGYQDWRLPTVDEAASLLEPSKRIGRYIDPVFNKKQQWIWTDDRDGSEAAWRVDFAHGFVGRIYVDYYIFVRPVRSVLSKDSGGEPEEEAYEEVEVLEEEELRKPKFRNVTLRSSRPVRSVLSKDSGEELEKEAYEEVEVIEEEGLRKPKFRNITLCSSYRDVSVSQVKTMPNISIRTKGLQGVAGHSTINHNYNLKTIRGDKVVLDHTTRLMWHQNGSDKNINYKKAKKWLMALNRSGYAGYNDWRLPTVEEAVSLLEPSKKSGNLYIGPVFSRKQRHIWTGDTKNGKEGVWRVDFYRGGVYRLYVNIYGYHFVRPVRSVE